jgi:hypothetical protein
MRQAFVFALIFWLPFEASIPLDQRITPLSSRRSKHHTAVISEVKAEFKTHNYAKNEILMTSPLTSKLSCNTHRMILPGQETG